MKIGIHYTKIETYDVVSDDVSEVLLLFNENVVSDSDFLNMNRLNTFLKDYACSDKLKEQARKELEKINNKIAGREIDCLFID